MQLETTLHLDDIVEMTNVAEHLSEQDRKVIAKHVIDTFEIDRMSRSQWEHEMAMANKIALQVKEEKSFPWPGAANVKFPLITIACLQYHSRAYPALIDMPDVVKVIPASGRQPSLQPNPQLQPGGAPGQMQPQQPQPPSPQITEAERNWTAAQAVQDHMNWQLSEEDEQWEAETDKTILVQALMGCCFKKIYFDPLKRHNVSECVLPQDLIVSYYTRSLEDASRITHILTWSGNKLIEMQNRGMILDVDVADAPKVVPVMFGELQQVRDQRQGLNQIATDPDQPFIILEQHLFLDLDDDGYKEPYVAWVKHDSQELLRIAPRFLPSGMEYARPDSKGDKKLIRIVPEKFFTKYGFIPAPDGGFYDLGFGKLLGPLNESINTSINQLFDAGTLKNAGGGFIARGVRTKSGEVSMRPALWMRVDCVGDDLRKNIVPLPVPEPSTVLFQLLSLLIDYGQRVAGAPDIVQGQNPGQNTPAETSRNMVEQGMQIFSGVYKRTYRSLRDEFRMLFRLNELFIEDTKFFSSSKGQEVQILAEFYKLPSTAIRPSADPKYMSDAQRMNQAAALLQAAHSSPGYNLYEVNKFYLKTLRIPGIDHFYPDPKGPNAVPPPPNPKVMVEQLKIQAKQMQIKQEMQLKLFQLMEDHRLNDAKIKQMEADAAAKIAGIDVAQSGQRIAELDAALGAARAQQDARSENIKMLHEIIKSMAAMEDTDQQREQDDRHKQMDMEMQRQQMMQPQPGAAQ